MVKWLYNSRGKPIAFIESDKVFSQSGRFIGRLDDNEVWHGSYKGEIVKGDRFLYKTTIGSATHSTPSTPATPATPSTPASKSSISLPTGYRDVDV